MTSLRGATGAALVMVLIWTTLLMSLVIYAEELLQEWVIVSQLT